MFSPQMMDHFEHPRNAGELDSPDASAQLTNPACGDVVRFTVRIHDGRVAEIRFLAQGCAAAIAAASSLTELILQQTVLEACSLTREALEESLGWLPPHSSHASHLAVDTLRAALLRQASTAQREAQV
jgi:nitrogen fixation NifU-like protein